MYQQQKSLFPLLDYEADFTPDCWKIPDEIAQRIAILVQPVRSPDYGTSRRNRTDCSIPSDWFGILSLILDELEKWLIISAGQTELQIP